MEAVGLDPDDGEGPFDPGATANEDAGSFGATNGQGGTNAPGEYKRPTSPQGAPAPGDPTNSPEGPAIPRSSETVDGSGSPGDEAYNGAEACSGSGVTERPSGSERTGAPGSRNFEGPTDDDSRTTKGPIPCETPGGPSCGGNETSTCPGAHSKNQRASRTEGPHAPPTYDEGPPSSRTNGNERSRDPETAKGPDVTSTEQDPSPTRQFSPGVNHGEIVSRATNKDGALKSASPTDSTMERPNNSGAPESFKKPAFPARPSGTEKATEPGDQPPAHSQSSSSLGNLIPSNEATQDVSTRLPSDAYRPSPAIPYKEPPWSGRPEAPYSLEILKGGSILSIKSLVDANWTVFGRLPTCHLSLEHPSVSRYHAVLQYRLVQGSGPEEKPGFYIYDLGSTHGTFLNKQQIQPKTYCRVRVGHVLKFGGSTRLFILQGPEDDQEEESELTVTQIKEARRQRESLQRRMMGDDDSDEEDNLEDGKKTPEHKASIEDTGCMWGMGEDALEEENEENPIAVEFQEEREALYLKNPKKALQGFFDREGEELEYEYEERSPGVWLCKVKLPIDDSSGKQLVAEVVHSGKKKEAVIVCFLEACRMLDMRGLLRQEAAKSQNWEDEDYYDSDDDTFLDRTGVVEKKRLDRMKKAGKIEEKPETYDSLVVKLIAVEKEISEIASQLQTSHPADSQSSAQDSLDAFMTEIKSGSSLDSVSRKKLHLKSFELKKEQQRLKGLIKIVKPTKLPDLSPSAHDPKVKKQSLPLFGAMKGGSKFKLKTGTVGKLPPKRTDLPVSFFSMKDDIEPEEEEEEEEEMQVATNQNEPGQSQKSDQLPHADIKPVPTVEETPPCVEPKKLLSDETASPRKSKTTASKSEDPKRKDPAVKPKKMQGPSMVSEYPRKPSSLLG
ncbi:hypothetical protein GDO86_018577, partial [Hymenochirus boettgeri]